MLRFLLKSASEVCNSQSIMSRQYTLQRTPKSTSVHIDYAAELEEQQLAGVTTAGGPLLVISGEASY
jgi:hypothetical protein